MFPLFSAHFRSIINRFHCNPCFQERTNNQNIRNRSRDIYSVPQKVTRDRSYKEIQGDRSYKEIQGDRSYKELQGDRSYKELQGDRSYKSSRVSDIDSIGRHNLRDNLRDMSRDTKAGVNILL